MSGRTRHLRDGELITNRKTDRRNPRSAPCELPFKLRLALPAAIAGTVSPGPTGVVGVTVDAMHYVEGEGHGLEWVCRQVADYLGRVGGGQNLELPFTVERGQMRFSHYLNYVPGPSVVFPRRLKRALVFEVKR